MHPNDTSFFLLPYANAFIRGNLPGRDASRTKAARLSKCGHSPFQSLEPHTCSGARLAAEMKLQTIGFADFHIAASAMGMEQTCDVQSGIIRGCVRVARPNL